MGRWMAEKWKYPGFTFDFSAEKKPQLLYIFSIHIEILALAICDHICLNFLSDTYMYVNWRQKL